MAGWVEVTHLGIRLPGWAADLGGYRLAHISDIHLGGGISQERAAEAVRLVNAQKPDLIVITGDLLSASPQRLGKSLTEVLAGLRAGDGVYTVMGNHDYDYDPAGVRAALRKAGARELCNEAISITRRGEGFHLAGLDSAYAGQADFAKTLAATPADSRPAILLAHEPDVATRSAASGRFGLQLSGHSHGGQVRAPGVGALFLPRLGRKYPRGHYQIGEMQLYTNRGLGTAHLPFRFRCPAEITIIDFQANEKPPPLR